MNGDGTTTQIPCPACKAPLVVPLRLRMVNRTEARVGVDLSAARAHIRQHSEAAL